MIDLKMKVLIKRQILLMIRNSENLVTMDMFLNKENEFEVKFDTELIKIGFKDLFEGGYITNGTSNRQFYADNHFELTRTGQEYTEHIKNQERWDKAMNICDRLEDFSERTINSVYDQLLQKEINELVNTPLNEVTNAIYNLAGEISSYNTQSMWRR